MKFRYSSKKVLLFICHPGLSQEVLDVLPAEGRDQLFHDYLMEEPDTLTGMRDIRSLSRHTGGHGTLCPQAGQGQ